MAKGSAFRVVTIESTRHVGVSRLGNSTYAVTFTDGTVAKTGVNSSVAIGITNSEYREGDWQAEFNSAGRLVGLRKVAAPEVGAAVCNCGSGDKAVLVTCLNCGKHVGYYEEFCSGACWDQYHRNVTR